MANLDHQQLNTVQSPLMPQPVTIASATTVAPTTFSTIISGTTDIATITPFVTGSHLLLFTFNNANPADLVETGNITIGGAAANVTMSPAEGESVLLFYDPITARYTALLLATTVA